MNSRPPRVATWVLQRSTGRSIDPLLGDLAEEYGSGRSTLWYWRQVVVAVLTGSFSQIRSHYILAARAIAVGWIVRWPFNYVWLPYWKLEGYYYSNNFIRVNLLAGLLWEFLPRFVTALAVAWIIGRLHRPYPMAMVLVYQAWFLSWQILDFSRLGLDSFEHPRYTPYLIELFVRFILWTAGAVVGGLLSAPALSDPPSTQLRVPA